MSRVLFALAGLAFLGATPAHGLYCGRPTEPMIPEDKSDQYRMEMAEEHVQDYMKKMQDYVGCLNKELTDAVDESHNVQTDWGKAVAKYHRGQ
jgi:hypothetical protein